MGTIVEKNYYSGKDSDGLFIVEQHQFSKIIQPPSIPELINGTRVSLAVSSRLGYLQRQVDTVVSHYESKNIDCYRFELESALISMKRIMDDLIMAAYCILDSDNVVESKYVKVDGYGSLFKSGKLTTMGTRIVNSHNFLNDDFAETLNELVNSFKHSYVLSDLLLWGADFPTVVSVYAHRNNYGKDISFHNHSLGQILLGFNNFVSKFIQD